MCIYHAVPLLDYTITGQDGQLLVTDAESLPIPEFDNIGMEVLPMVQIFNSPKASIVNLFNAGYNPRYFNWKTKLDVINGAFTTTLKSWVAPVTESLLSGWFGFGYNEGDVNKDTNVVLNYKFFKVNPTVLALRQAEALQRWKEISQSGDSDYREQIRKHFGVNLPQSLSNMCTYIGGISRNL